MVLFPNKGLKLKGGKSAKQASTCYYASYRSCKWSFPHKPIFNKINKKLVFVQMNKKNALILKTIEEENGRKRDTPSMNAK